MCLRSNSVELYVCLAEGEKTTRLTQDGGGAYKIGDMFACYGISTITSGHSTHHFIYGKVHRQPPEGQFLLANFSQKF